MADQGRKPRRRRRWIFVLALLFAAWWWFSDSVSLPEIEDGSYVLVDIGGTYHERVPDDLVTRLSGVDGRSLVDLLLLIRAARDDPRVAGLVTRIRGLNVGWAKAQEVRLALREFRDAGKKVIAYIEDEFGNSTLEYFLATATDRIYVPPAGSPVLSGILAEYMFLGGVWEKLDVDMQVVKIGRYKTAGDMYERKSMSEAHREMANSLLDSLYEQFISAVADGRGLPEGDVRRLVDRGPLSVDELESTGLIDGARFLDEIESELAADDAAVVRARDYEPQPHPEQEAPSARVAIVYGNGVITTGESADGVFADEASMGADTLRETFEDVAADEEVDAIVFRIDSPGGSALASDLIWRATQQARSEKPIIVSMSDVAGSGGYYVAAGANQIVASPGTLTGSIGVVLAKPNIKGLLDKLGIHTASLQRGESAGMVSVTQSFDAEQLRRIQASMENTYALFVDRVASGRSMSLEDVDAVGRGRVWTGEQAHAKGLVDQLGGLLVAIDEAKKAIGLDPKQKVEVVFYPRERGLFERIADALATRMEIRLPRLWSRLRGALAAFDFPDGSILTLMPHRIEVR